MSSRDAILGSIRQALGRQERVSDSTARQLNDRLENPKSHVRPALQADKIVQFTQKIETAGASVQHLLDFDDVASAVVEYLKDNQLASKIVTTADDMIANINWPSFLDVEMRAATGDDKVSVTSAVMAVAEAGTLVLTSDPSTPTTLNFLPDHHIVVLPTAGVSENLEDVWPKLRCRYAELPRTVNLISGPSKTADVEQTMQLGAHGPRRLHVILYD